MRLETSEGAAAPTAHEHLSLEDAGLGSNIRVRLGSMEKKMETIGIIGCLYIYIWVVVKIVVPFGYPKY